MTTQTPAPPLTDRTPFLIWAAETGDALDAQAHLARFEDIASVLVEPTPPSPDVGTTSTPTVGVNDRYPEPAHQLRFTATLLAGLAITAVAISVATTLRRRHRP